MKTALVVSGGGDKGAFAVGAVQVIRERDPRFDLAVGTSTGALIAPMVALGEYDELESLYTSVRKKDVVRANWTRLFLTGIYHTRPIEKIIRRVISEGDPSRYDRLMLSDTAVLLCTVSLQSRSVRYYSQHGVLPDIVPWGDKEGFVQAVLGSMSQPFIMTVPRLGDEQLVDGGVREIAPIGAALRAGAERIYAVVNMPEVPGPENRKIYKNVATIGMRTLDLMSEETLLNDVKMAQLYNDALEHLGEVPETSRFHGRKKVELVVVRPEKPLPSGGLDFEPAVMKEMVELGRAAAQKVLEG